MSRAAPGSGLQPGGEASLLVAPRTRVEQEQFERWCAATLIWYGPRLGAGLVVALILWWPTDLIIYRGMPHAQEAMADFRLTVAVVLGLPSLILPRIAWARRHPLAVIELVAIVAALLSAWHMARAGASAPFWFAFTYVVPLFSVAFLESLPGRIVVATLMSAAAASGFLLGPGLAMSAPEMRAGLSFLAFSTLMSIAIGHAVYLLVRTGFLMRLRVDEQRERLAELTRHLEDRVSEQTRQLRLLHRQSQEAGAEQRRLVARDLHDGLGQELSSLRLLVGLGRDISADPAPRALFEELDGLVERVQLSLRGVLEALRPRLLHQQSLVDALRSLLAETERRWGLETTLEIGEVPSPLPPAVSAALFRVAQEGLHNVLRHADATRVDVRLHREGRALVLEVQDNGRGLTGDPSEGRGMEHIRERALELGGLATWTGDPGTTLRVSLPLEEP